MLRNKQRGFGGIAMYMGIVLVIVLAGSAAYFKYSQDKLAEANKEIAAQTARAVSAEANFEFLKESVRKQQKAIDKLAEASVEIRQEQQETIDIFAEHDLKALAERKPGLIEIRVNRATDRVFDELERITNPLSYEPLAQFTKEEEE